MKNRITSLFLAFCMIVSALPTVAMAAENTTAPNRPAAPEENPATTYFDDTDVTWLGSLEEYQQTLDGLYFGGLRKVAVGSKYGIVDITGNFVVPPIYDTISAPGKESPVQLNFTGGYTQVSRGGKVGLINTLGQEVIPAIYEAVGLPSEGICRIISISENRYLLGYWSLELGRPIVDPKYPVTSGDATNQGVPFVRALMDPSAALVAVEAQSQAVEGVNTGTHIRYDFLDGYALVPVSITRMGDAGVGFCREGTIIDKTGKEILPGGPYIYPEESYPQFGPYMIFCKMSTKDFFYNRTTNLGKAWESGVVGPEGIIMPAKYTGGIRVDFNWFMSDARIMVHPSLKLISMARDMAPGKEDGGRVGVVNFKGDVVIPFTHDYNGFTYFGTDNVFTGANRSTRESTATLYNADGKQLHSTFEYIPGTMKNGYSAIRVALPASKDPADGVVFTDGFVHLATGKEWIPDVIRYAKGSDHLSVRSHMSTDSTVWLRSESGLWGLYQFGGKEIIAPKYTSVSTDGVWLRKENPNAVAKMVGKVELIAGDGSVLIPSIYTRIFRNLTNRYMLIADTNGKTGFYDLAAQKEVIKPQFGSIGILHDEKYYFEYGAQAVRVEGDGGINSKVRFIDNSGNYVSETYQYLNPPSNGYYRCSVTPHYVVSLDGKMIFEKEVTVKNYAFVVKYGKVGYIKTSRLAVPRTSKPGMALSLTATPSPTNYMLNGKPIAVDSYIIGDNNYVKLRDMAAMINGSAKNFNVVWDDVRGAINMTSHSAYTPVGKELTVGDGNPAAAVFNNAPIYKDGVRVFLGAYTIGGNNYFKLRDVMKLFNVAVGYENGTATLDTSKVYILSADEAVGITARPSALVFGYIAPSTEPVLPEPQVRIETLPIKQSYKKGEAFDSTGFKSIYRDIYANPTNISDEYTFKSGDVDMYDGYILDTLGDQFINCYRNGKVETTFKIHVKKA